VASDPSSQRTAITRPTRASHPGQESGQQTGDGDAGDEQPEPRHVPAAGQDLFGALAATAQAHEQAWTDGLDAQDRQELAALLRKLVAARGLAPGVHPGYQRVGVPGLDHVRTQS
jgi:hypothetical protein